MGFEQLIKLLLHFFCLGVMVFHPISAESLIEAIEFIVAFLSFII